MLLGVQMNSNETSNPECGCTMLESILRLWLVGPGMEIGAWIRPRDPLRRVAGTELLLTSTRHANE